MDYSNLSYARILSFLCSSYFCILYLLYFFLSCALPSWGLLEWYGWSLTYWSMDNFPVTIPLIKMTPLLLLTISVGSSSGRGRISWAPLLSMMECWLAPYCVGLIALIHVYTRCTALDSAWNENYQVTVPKPVLNAQEALKGIYWIDLRSNCI